MKEYQILIKTEEEAINFAYILGKQLFPGSVITLTGELGVGKTTFTKGIAQALNINEVVNSPTFTIIKEYNGDLPLYHMDVYRLDDDFEDLGFDEYFYGEGITVIEWPEKIKSQLPPHRLDININLMETQERLIILKPLGKEYERLCEELKDEKIID